MAEILQATEAGKELAKTVAEAYDANENKELIVNVKCLQEQQVNRIIFEIVLEAKLEEVRELIPRKAMFFPRPSLGSLVYSEDSNRKSACSVEVVRVQDGVVELHFIIHGEEEEFRWQYAYNDYIKRNLHNLLDRVEKLREEDRVLEVASWVVEKVEVKLGVSSDEVGVSQRALWEGTAVGDDEVLAEAFLFYASLIGIDTDHYMFPKEIEDWERGEKPFFWNVVKIEGREYYLDMVKMSEIKQQNGSIRSSECQMFPKEKVEELGEYQAWTPAWRDYLPFSNVSPV